MTQKKQIANPFHPYIFALKEGKKIEDDLLDYSLLLLQRFCTEVIKSPLEKPVALTVEENNLPL